MHNKVHDTRFELMNMEKEWQLKYNTFEIMTKN